MPVKPSPRPPYMIGALLRIPFQETVRRVLEDLLAAGFVDLRAAHLAVFQHLSPGGTRPSELAERAQITKQSMGYLVEHLVAAGYVEQVSDPRDGRARLVRLTERGRAVDDAARDSMRSLEAEWAISLGADRYAQLKAALTDLVETIERP